MRTNNHTRERSMHYKEKILEMLLSDKASGREEACEVMLRIPMKGCVNSFNLAMATGVILSKTISKK